MPELAAVTQATLTRLISEPAPSPNRQLRLADLRLTPIDFMTVVAAIEDRFDAYINDIEIASCETLGELADRYRAAMLEHAQDARLH